MILSQEASRDGSFGQDNTGVLEQGLLMFRSEGFRVHAFGVSLNFASSLPEAVRALKTRVVLQGWQTSSGANDGGVRFSIEPCGRNAFGAYRDGSFLFADVGLDQVVKSLASTAHHWLATHSDHVFIHAGAVAYKGKVVILPGRSYAGKSTLTLALVERGAEYFSDEYAVVNPLTGLVEPFPRPCHLRNRGQVDLASGVTLLPKPLGWVFALEYVANGGWSAKPMTPGEMIMAIFDNAVAAQRLGSTCLGVLARSAGSARGWVGSRTEACEGADQILSLLNPSP